MHILLEFDLDSNPISCFPLGNGHINKTYEVKTEKNGHYILQKVNDNVFKDVDTLMRSINYVSSYLIEKDFESLHLIKTKMENYTIKKMVNSSVYIFFLQIQHISKNLTQIHL